MTVDNSLPFRTCCVCGKTPCGCYPIYSTNDLDWNTSTRVYCGQDFMNIVQPVDFKNQLKWDRRFLSLAKEVSTWSKDPSTQVGAVLVNKDKIVVGMGYNGFARGVDDSEERYNNRELKYKYVCHAEVNAIINAGHAAKGCTLYVYPAFVMPPICNDCCKYAIQAGVKEIVGHKADENSEVAQRWKESILISRNMCLEAGIFWRDIEPQ